MPLYYPPANVTIGGNSTSGGAGYALISTGTVNLAGGNNITLSQAGNSITVYGAGGNNITASYWPDVFPASTSALTYYSGSLSVGAAAASTNTSYTVSYYIQPFVLPCNIAYTQVGLVVNYGTSAGTGSATNLWSLGIYSNNASTLSLIQDYYGGIYVSQNSQTSCNYLVWAGNSTTNNILQFVNGVTNASYSKTRYVRVDNNGIGVTLTGGNYWFIFGHFFFTSSSNIMQNNGWMNSSQFAGGVPALELGNTSNSYRGTLMSGWGVISSTYASLSSATTFSPVPQSIALTNITTSFTNTSNYRLQFFQLRGL